MASHPHKLRVQLISILMAVAIMGPTMIKLGHAFHGHWNEQECVAYGTDHIHSNTIDCAFNDHTLNAKVLFIAQFVYTPIEVHKQDYNNGYISPEFENSESTALPLRGPPGTT